MATRKKQPKTPAYQSVLDAFLPKIMTVAGLDLQPISALHYLCLQRISSPLIENGAKATPTDIMAALLICTLEPAALSALFAGGVDVFWRECDLFAGRIDMAGLLEAPAKVTAHIDAAFANAMIPTDDGGEGDDAPFAPQG